MRRFVPLQHALAFVVLEPLNDHGDTDNYEDDHDDDDNCIHTINLYDDDNDDDDDDDDGDDDDDVFVGYIHLLTPRHAKH